MSGRRRKVWGAGQQPSDWAGWALAGDGSFGHAMAVCDRVGQLGVLDLLAWLPVVGRQIKSSLAESQLNSWLSAPVVV